jgi:cyclase
MMEPIRVIARLDIKGENVIKGVHLEGLRVVGKPGPMALKYYEQGADEILFMDVVASLYGRNGLLPIVRQAAQDIFVPLTVGGGIRKVEDIVDVLRSGADKVAINTAAVARPEFLNEAASRFGSQCIVLSVEAQQRGPNQWEVLTDNGRENTGRAVLDWVVEATARGVGEIILTSVDREGTKTGFDLPLMQAVRRAVSVPVIACGGAGGVDDVSALLTAGGADAVCCASIFHYDLCPLPDLKRALAERGHTMRLEQG